jgi:hypothetical protein
MNPDPTPTRPAAEYPDRDGAPMADNTLQWDWMVKIVGELREVFAGQRVFVAGDLFWYPVQGEPKTRMAPDALVAFDRPAGYRGSYKQWEEDGVPPAVVFEVMSPSNTRKEMAEKLKFYERHGASEYYLIDPDRETVLGYVRDDGVLRNVTPMTGFVSPALGIRFEDADGVKLFTPDGREFRTREDRVSEIQVELQRTAAAFEDERRRAIEEQRRADAAGKLAELFAAKLRELGVDPDGLTGTQAAG